MIYETIIKIIIPVMTKSKLKTCDPYMIRYPIPFLDTSNSPIITPIRDILIFIFRLLMIVL